MITLSILEPLMPWLADHSPEWLAILLVALSVWFGTSRWERFYHRFTTLESSVDRLRTEDLPRIERTLASMESKLDRLHFEDVPRLEHRVARVELDIHRLRTEDFPRLEHRVALVELDVHRLRTEDVPRLEQRIASVESSVNYLQTSHVPLLTRRLEVLESHVGQLRMVDFRSLDEKTLPWKPRLLRSGPSICPKYGVNSKRWTKRSTAW